MLRRLCSQIVGVPSSTLQRAASNTAAVTAIEAPLQSLDYDALLGRVSTHAVLSPQRPHKFMLLLEKATTAGEAQQALALLREDRLRRNREGCHRPYNSHVTCRLLLTLQKFGQDAELASTLQHATELGLSLSQRSTDALLRKLSSAKSIAALEMVYLCSLLQLERPSKAMIFTMMKTFAEQQQPKKVLEYAADSTRFNVPLSPAGQALLESAQAQRAAKS